MDNVELKKKEKLGLWENKIKFLGGGWFIIIFFGVLGLSPELPFIAAFLMAILIPAVISLGFVAAGSAFCGVINYTKKRMYWGKDYKIKEKMWEIKYLLCVQNEKIEKFKKEICELEEILRRENVSSILENSLIGLVPDMDKICKALEEVQNELRAKERVDLKTMGKVRELYINLGNYVTVVRAFFEPYKCDFNKIRSSIRSIGDSICAINIRSEEILRHEHIGELKECVDKLINKFNGLYACSDYDNDYDNLREEFMYTLDSFSEISRDLTSCISYYERGRDSIKVLKEESITNNRLVTKLKGAESKVREKDLNSRSDIELQDFKLEVRPKESLNNSNIQSQDVKKQIGGPAFGM